MKPLHFLAAAVLAASSLGLVRVLRLAPPLGGWRTFGYAFAAMLPVLAAINGLAVLLAPAEMVRDFTFFKDIARSDAVVVTGLAIGWGAPVSEELLFRGFLLTALSATALGFWPAAAIASLGWTLLHLSYSWIGLLEVFAIGIYFSWLLWRTGSLWPPLACHAIYNASLLAILRFWPA